MRELHRTAKWRDPPEEIVEKTEVVPERGWTGRTSCTQYKD